MDRRSVLELNFNGYRDFILRFITRIPVKSNVRQENGGYKTAWLAEMNWDYGSHDYTYTRVKDKLKNKSPGVENLGLDDLEKRWTR